MTYELSDEEIGLVVAGLHVVRLKGMRDADRRNAAVLIDKLENQKGRNS